MFLYNKNLSGQEEAQRKALDAQAEMGRTLQSLSTDLQNAQNFCKKHSRKSSLLNTFLFRGFISKTFS